ncbi:MAG: hypothetical protein KI790_13120 [Cyclobacteriaceae bacterium]|nr:hypothetical protein [Cyclobacteriaceae bacterium HetDA_MAG_MS6]
MTENNFPDIQTERLLLTRSQNADWKVVSFLHSDKKVNEFIDRPNAETQEKALEFIEKINTGIDNRNLYYWK